MAPPPHIAVVAFPFSSHAAVMLSFVHALAAAAPDGTAISFVTTADYALLGNLRFVEVADGLPAPSGQMPMLPSPRRMELFMAAQGGASLRWRRQAEVAAATGAPWVPVWTAASCALLAHIRTDALRQDIADQGTSCTSERLMV
ncbi:anthocyanidin 3-O-glucosyltransferase-like [Lolium perenne]|uniref:anthocyanidin 3-O-glucosyltransferase-like n=1 Tax=Lolium perenne TaxID=4522 RepID=UPI003A98EF2E